MLHIEEPVVKRGKLTGFSMPGFRAWVRSVDGEMHDFRHTDGPFLDEEKLRFIPVRIGNKVDGNDQAELTRHLQGLQILIEGDALAVQVQCLFVQRLDTKKHIQEAEPLPIREDFTVAQ